MQKDSCFLISKTAKSKMNVPEAKGALDRFKMEAAKEVDVQSPLEENIQHTERSAKT